MTIGSDTSCTTSCLLYKQYIQIQLNINTQKVTICINNKSMKYTQSGNKGLRVMVFNATFNNISAISLQSVLLVEETGVPGKKHQSVASH